MQTLKTHPHKYALDLFKLSLDRIPVTVPRAISEQFHSDYEAMCSNPEVTGEAVEDLNMKLGRAIWAYLKSYDELYEKFGKQKEHDAFLESLRADVREHFVEWNKKNGLIFDLRRADEFETEFAAEEKFAIEEAYLDASEAARSYMDELVVGEKKMEYEAALKVWQDRQEELQERINILRGMAHVNEKWTSEILDKVRNFELGWAVTEKDPELYEVEKEIESWRGVLGVDTLGE